MFAFFKRKTKKEENILSSSEEEELDKKAKASYQRYLSRQAAERGIRAEEFERQWNERQADNTEKIQRIGQELEEYEQKYKELEEKEEAIRAQIEEELDELDDFFNT